MSNVNTHISIWNTTMCTQTLKNRTFIFSTNRFMLSVYLWKLVAVDRRSWLLMIERFRLRDHNNAMTDARVFVLYFHMYYTFFSLSRLGFIVGITDHDDRTGRRKKIKKNSTLPVRHRGGGRWDHMLKRTACERTVLLPWERHRRR